MCPQVIQLYKAGLTLFFKKAGNVKRSQGKDFPGVRLLSKGVEVEVEVWKHDKNCFHTNTHPHPKKEA